MIIVTILSSLIIISGVGAQSLSRTFFSSNMHSDSPMALAEHQGILYSANFDGSVKAFNSTTGQFIADLVNNDIRHLVIADDCLFGAGEVFWQYNLTSRSTVRTLNLGDYAGALEQWQGRVFLGIGTEVRYYNVSSGALIATATVTGSSVQALLVTDDKLFVARYNPSNVFVNSLIDGTELYTFTQQSWEGNYYGTTKALARWGNYVITAGAAGRFRRWTLAGAQDPAGQIFQTTSLSSPYDMAIFGNLLYMTSSGSPRAADLSTNTVLTPFAPKYAHTLCISGSTIYMGHTVRINAYGLTAWDLNTLTQIWEAAPNPLFNAVASSKDYAVAGRVDGTMFIWNKVTGSRLEIIAHTNNIVSLTIASNFVFSSSWDGTAKQWSLATGQLIRSVSEGSNYINSVRVVGNFMYTVTSYGAFRQWNLNSGAITRNYTLSNRFWSWGKIEANSKYQVAGASVGSNKIFIWDVETGELITDFACSTYSPLMQLQGDLLYYEEWAGSDVYLQVRNIPTGETRSIPVDRVINTFQVQGDYVFVGYEGWIGVTKTVDVIRADTGVVVLSFSSVAQPFIAVTDDRLLYAARSFVGEYIIPGVVPAVVTTLMPELEVHTTTTTTTTPTVVQGNSQSSSAISTQVTIFSVVGGGLLLGVVLSFGLVARMRKHYGKTTTFSGNTYRTSSAVAVAAANSASNYGEVTSLSTVTDATVALPTITTLQGVTVGNTLVTQTAELSIPGFLEVQWGMDFMQGEYVAKGGGGTIYTASALQDGLKKRSGGNALVLKNIAENLETLSEKMRNAFLQELSITWRFRDHPNFIRVYGYSLRPVCLIMKHYQHGDLSKYIKGGNGGELGKLFPYSKSNVLSLLRQMSDAFSHMHRAGMVHNDIKPGNILMDVTPENQLMAVVTDFGITRIVDEKSLKVDAFIVVDIRGLSAGYAAPEAWDRLRRRTLAVNDAEKNPEYWKASDAFSIAMMTYHMLMRTSPWHPSIKAQSSNSS